MAEKITKLSIFDFDGTLVDTPLPDEAKKIWLEKKGTPWPHEGYWGRAESLDMDVFDMPLVNSVIAAYNQERAKQDTLVVMLTGRLQKLSSYVEAVLNDNGLIFDGYYYNRGGETCDSKIKSMDTMLSQYLDITEVLMFEDRLAHVVRFEAWGQAKIAEGRLTKFHVTVVPTTHHGE